MNVASYGETRAHFRVPRGSFFDNLDAPGAVFWCFLVPGRVLLVPWEGSRGRPGWGGLVFEQENIASRRGHSHIPEKKCLW